MGAHRQHEPLAEAGYTCTPEVAPPTGRTDDRDSECDCTTAGEVRLAQLELEQRLIAELVVQLGSLFGLLTVEFLQGYEEG